MIKLITLFVFLASSVSADEFLYIGSGLWLPGKNEVVLDDQLKRHDFTETVLVVDGIHVSLYVGFHPWYEKKGGNVIRNELISRYEYPIIISVTGYADRDPEVDILMVIIENYFAKPLYLHASMEGYNDALVKRLVDVFRNVEYRDPF